jgi:hypothetical protein
LMSSAAVPGLTRLEASINDPTTEKRRFNRRAFSLDIDPSSLPYSFDLIT